MERLGGEGHAQPTYRGSTEVDTRRVTRPANPSRQDLQLRPASREPGRRGLERSDEGNVQAQKGLEHCDAGGKLERYQDWASMLFRCRCKV